MRLWKRLSNYHPGRTARLIKVSDTEIVALKQSVQVGVKDLLAGKTLAQPFSVWRQ